MKKNEVEQLDMLFRIKFTGNTLRYTSFLNYIYRVSSIQSNFSTHEKNCILSMSFDFKILYICRWLQKYLEHVQ